MAGSAMGRTTSSEQREGKLDSGDCCRSRRIDLGGALGSIGSSCQNSFPSSAPESPARSAYCTFPVSGSKSRLKPEASSRTAIQPWGFDQMVIDGLNLNRDAVGHFDRYWRSLGIRCGIRALCPTAVGRGHIVSACPRIAEISSCRAAMRFCVGMHGLKPFPREARRGSAGAHSPAL